MRRQRVFTLAEVLFFNSAPLEWEVARKSRKGDKKAFTLAEVLITLVVIGVIAAITVPILHNDTADKKWNVARQKAQATIGEAFRLMTINGEIADKKSNGQPLTTADFVNKIIPKYLKVEKTCAPANYEKCGFPDTVKTPSGVSIGNPQNWKWTELSSAKKAKDGLSYEKWNNNNVVAISEDWTWNTVHFFRTLDGFSVAFFYNPDCVNTPRDRYTFSQGNGVYRQQIMDVTCLMGIYDMNGKAKPNQVGKDIGFVGSFYNGFETKAVAVLPHSKEVANTNSLNETGFNTSRAWINLYKYCENIDKDKSWIMPDINELSLIYLNSLLVRGSKDAVDRWFASRTRMVSVDNVLNVSFNANVGGARNWYGKSKTDDNGPYVRCVRRTSLR